MPYSTIALVLAVSLSGTPATDSAKTKKSTKERTYCIQYDDLVGSRIRKADCLTKKQWADQGVDVDEMLKPPSK